MFRMLRTFLLILALTVSTACTKVHFGAPTATLGPGVEVTVKHAMAKRGYVHVVAMVTNWTNQPMFVDTYWWRLRLPDGYTMSPEKRKVQQLMVHHGDQKKIVLLYKAKDIEMELVPGMDLVVGGVSPQPGQVADPVGVVRLGRLD